MFDITPQAMGSQLEGILDEVRRYATQKIPGAMGQTAAQGRALLGIGEISGGVRKESMGNEAAMQRLKVSESGSTARAGLGEAGATRRTSMGNASRIEQQALANSGAMAVQKMKEEGDTTRARLLGKTGLGLGEAATSPLRQAVTPAAATKATPAVTPEFFYGNSSGVNSERSSLGGGEQNMEYPAGTVSGLGVPPATEEGELSWGEKFAPF